MAKIIQKNLVVTVSKLVKNEEEAELDVSDILALLEGAEDIVPGAVIEVVAVTDE